MVFLARVVLLIAFFFPLLPGGAVAQDTVFPGRFEGRWNLILRTPNGSYQTPVEFTLRDGGRVTATVLGPLGTFRISDATGTLEGARLRLSATSSFGNLRVAATIEGGRLRGEWFPAGIVSRMFFRGEVRGTRDDTYVPRPRTEIYAQVWTHIERGFYALDYNAVDIRAARDRYYPLVAASRTDGEFLSIMRRMLGEFRTSHLDLFATPIFVRDEQNSTPPEPAAETHGISWRQLTPSIGYLRIESFEDGPSVVERIDSAFAALSHNAALVVDVRDNGGGTLSAAMRLGDYFFPERRPVGYFASRQGLVSRGASTMESLDASTLPVFTGYRSPELGAAMNASGAVMLVTGGRAPQPYRGRVILLVDEYCFSACEALAGAAKETAAATLIGRRTAGAMLAAIPVSIDGGWTLVLPVWDFRTPRGVRVEGSGVEPDVAVRSRGRRDADLAAALRFLRRAGVGNR